MKLKYILPLCAVMVMPATAAVDAKTRLVDILKMGFTFQGDFTQVVKDDKGGKRSQRRGFFKIKRPGKFLWQYYGRPKIKIISNGKRVWVEDPDLKQVTHASVKRILVSSPAVVLVSPEALERDFTLVNSGQNDGVHWVRIIPKKKQNVDYEYLFVGMSGKNLSRLSKIKVVDSFNRTIIISMSNIKYDKPLSDALFNYKPPPIYDVIE